MRVLFVYYNPRKMSLVPPSIALFSRLLKSMGVEVKLFDSTFYKYEDTDVDDIKEKNLIINTPDSKLEGKIKYSPMSIYEGLEKMVNEFRPDLLAATSTEGTFTETVKLLQCVKDYDIPVIMGGIFATFAPEIVIRCPEIDMLCVGEGEKAIVELVKKMMQGEDYSNVTNLWVKKNGQIIKNQIAQPVELDNNPLFDMEIFDEARFYRAMGGKVYKMFPVETHRGCNNKCAFCGSSPQNKMYVKETNHIFFRYKSIPKVHEEISYYKKLGAEYLFFWADNLFTYPIKMIDEFCEMYSDFRIPFFCQAHPNSLSEEKTKKLKAAGMSRLGIGIEHGNEKFRREVIHRYYTNEKLVKGFSMLTNYDIEYSVNNIVGFPDETPELVMDTVELNRKHKGANTSCSIFTPFHGTALRRVAIKKGYLKDDTLAPPTEAASCLQMPQFTPEEILGKRRTFNMYVKFPKSRWDEIKLAETDDKIWERLREEYVNIYS